MTRGRLWAVLIVLALVAGAGFHFARSVDGGNTLRPDDIKVVAQGEKIYAKYCASCHGENLKGQPNWRQRGPNGLLPAPPHDASGHTWHHPDELLFKMTKLGPAKLVGDGYLSAMPGYETTLSDAEIIAALSYIKSRWPAEIRSRHDSLNRRYAAENKRNTR
jgi:mono/diheme cytochrome c family protein